MIVGVDSLKEPDDAFKRESPPRDDRTKKYEKVKDVKGHMDIWPLGMGSSVRMDLCKAVHPMLEKGTVFGRAIERHSVSTDEDGGCKERH